MKALLTLVTLLVSLSHLRAADRPNILVFVADDLGYGDFSALGHPVLKTPHLDQLRRESVVLSRFYVSPLCAPTRAALLTGRHQFRTGVWDTSSSRANLANDEVTLAEYLARAGYRTGAFGKWHLGENHPFRPQDQGFGATFIWNNTDRFRPTFSRDGVTTPPYARFLTEEINDEALRFMAAARERPFFAWVASFLPHTHNHKQIGDDYVRPFADNPAVAPKDRETYGMIAKLDEDVGRLLRGLREQGLEDNTIVVFLSDNGPAATRFNAGLRGTKNSVHEGGIRVPVFVRWPARLAPREIAVPLAAIDLLPTLLEAAGVNATEKPIDGVSFWPLLTQRAERLPARLLFEQQQPQNSGRTPEPWRNARVFDGRHSLVFTEGEASGQLFDLSADSGETVDLAPRLPDVTARLKSAYIEWFRTVSSERGFRLLECDLGHPAQRTVMLVHSQFDTAEGYPLRVARAGEYRVDIREIQPRLYPDGGAIGLTDGKTVWRASVRRGATEAGFSMRLPAGPLRLFPHYEGKLPERTRLGAEVHGFHVMLVTGPSATEP